MAKRSLYEKPETVETGMAIPSGNSMATVVAPEQESYSNYAAQMHRDKGKWADVKQVVTDVADGDMVLFSDEPPQRIAPFVFWLLDCHQYWCVKDAEFKPRKTWLQKPADKTFQGTRIDEYLASMILLQVGDTVVPATFRVNGAMCKGVYAALTTATQDNAAWAEWLKQSPDHTATSPLQANLRFKTHLTWRAKKGFSGFPYFISAANIIPTSLGDAAMFKAMQGNAEMKEKATLMSSAFAEHKQHIEQLAK